jgi:membrane protein implicated in regulation of membrane protease activity
MRKSSLLVILLAGLALVAAALAAPVSAHHGWSQYQDEQFEITGTLETPVSFAGPHATTRIRVGDEVWDIVLAPSLRTARAGLTNDVIPVGDTVTASGHRHLDPETLEIKTERLTWNDTVFNVYPDRN